MKKSKKIALWTVAILFFSAVLFGIIFIGTYQDTKKNLSENIIGEWSRQSIFYQGQEYQYRDDLINILCMGIDKDEQMAVRNEEGDSIGQSDVIMLLSLDLKKKEIRILIIPRDVMVTLQMYDSDGLYMGEMEGQLTLQYAYADGQVQSAELMAKQVSSLLNDIPLNGYAAINIYSLWMLNEAVGGVDVTMEEDYTYIHPAFEKGAAVHLTQKMAEDYIRVRDTNIMGSAYTRIGRLKQYMSAFFDKAKEAVKKDVMFPIEVMEMLEKNIETDLSAKEITYLAMNAINCTFSNKNMYTLQGEIIYNGEYEEFYPDEKALDKLIVELFYEQKENND